MIKYRNPVIKGFNPDPSICRVDDDYYLVTSTFEFFPGVPVYHSKNLVDWKLINYCLTRDSQLNLKGCRPSGGIYAPTIRYHEGIFYMITTNVSSGGNFIVHTNDVYGKWSEPSWIDHHGIDPSLLFDDDGRVYFCGTDNETGGIAFFEINPLTGDKLSEKKIISYGAGGKCPEAPHIYKINAYYYLMIAEGGTEYGHMETIFRSKSPYGPYKPCPHNPILSHKDFMGSSIQATGHADIVEDTNGNWWLVCLGIRPLPGVMLHNLGRETFLAPLDWDEDGWPVVGDQGRISMEMEGELPAPLNSPETSTDLSFEYNDELNDDFYDNFNDGDLKLEWNFARNPERDNYSLTEKKGFLKLSAGPETLNDSEPTFLGIRQKEFEVTARTGLTLDFSSDEEKQKAGLTAYYSQDYHYEIYITHEEGKDFVVLSKRVHDIECVDEKLEINYQGKIELMIETGTEDYMFSYRLQDDWVKLGAAKTAGLCTEGTMTMTFTGTYLGIFASNTDAYFGYFSVYQ